MNPIAYMHKWPNGKTAFTPTEKPPGGFDGWAAVTTPLYAELQSAAASAGHWYAIDREGMATLCADEADARKNAKEAAEQFPRRAPYVAAQLVVLSVGWKIVPLVPTDAMQDEGAGAARDEHGRHDCASIGYGHAEAVYSAMLAAAPEPPK